MRPYLLAALTVSFLSTAGGRTIADDAPHNLLEKAIKAMGGEKIVARPMAVHYKMRGKVPLGGKEEYAFTGEVFTQPNADFKYTFDLNANQEKINITMVLVGEKGWRISNMRDLIEDVDPAELAEMKIGRYYDRVTSLVPVLKEKGFTLESLGELKIRDKPALGVKVSSAGQPDIKMFFDKTTSLLIKTEYRAKAERQDRDVLHESYYSDWREPDRATADEKTLKGLNVKTDGPALLDYLRKRMPAGGDAARIKQLVEQLGDDLFEAREKATKELIAIGAAALPQLREAAEKGETEVKRRAKQCLKAIGDFADEKSLLAAVRLVGWGKPDGAAEVLLDWAARLADDPLGREVRSALAGVAVEAGKPAEVLVKALDDKDSARRAAAAAALGRDGGLAEKKPGRRLFIMGLKFPMKAEQHLDGVKSLEREYTEIEFFNRFDDSLFVKPK
jgi:hypothetical protein